MVLALCQLILIQASKGPQLEKLWHFLCSVGRRAESRGEEQETGTQSGLCLLEGELRSVL